MDSSSAQGNHETGQRSHPRETTSTQENEIGSGCWTSEATEEKHTSSTEYVYKESAEARDADFKYNGAEQVSPLHGDLTRNSSCEQLAPQPEDNTLNYNSVQLGLLTEDEAGQKLSAKQAMSEISNNIVRESVNSEALVEKQKVGTEQVQNGPAETGMVEFYYLGLEQSSPHSEDVTKNSSWGQLRPTPEDGGKSSLEHSGLAPEDAAANTSLEQLKPLPDNLKQLELPPEDAANNPSLEDAANNLEDEGKSSLEQLGLAPEDAVANTNLEQLNPLPDILSKNSDLKPLEPLPEDAANNPNLEDAAKNPKDEGKSSLEQLGLPPEDATVNTSLEQLKTLSDNPFENCDLKPLELPPEDAASKPSKSGSRGRRTSAKSTKGNHVLRSSVGSARVLRSRSQEKSKAPEPINNLPEHGDGTSGEKRRTKKKKQKKEIPVDEFSRIRKHLRYLLNRRNYEQNLIDAYSGEGWKGLSLEKIKPEKELQRAKSEIFRCKLKIRDLFQRLDFLIAEGKLPESMFDSEGQIDSEDIFCAKCGSKDLEADNDIILCDGACERAFHQFCLEPPLLKEDIPPDDDGWLCPGCDCKVDCIDLLNDSQGTNLSVLDTWEKVFPEAAAAAAAGNKLDDNFGLPSDDSEDNDYNPDGSEVDEEVEGDDSSSDESDFSSASEDFGALLNNKQNLELPSDDSEDDEYDPDAPDLDEKDKQESSSSDFTSDSEDFSIASNDKGPSYKVEAVPDEPMPAPSDHTKPFRGSNGERSKVGCRKKNSFNDELSSLLESGTGQGESAGVSGRRLVERLDYKMLYDETYGNVSSDSSDEVWMDAADAPRKRRKNYSDKIASASPGVRTPIKEGTNAKDINHNQEEREHTPKRRARKKLHVEGTNHSPAKSYKVSSEPGSSSTKRSPYQRLGEAVTQGLIKSFKENQYPERAAKENLAKELGITAHQVSKWFENARWSFRHTSRMESVLIDSVPSKGTPPQTSVSEPGPKAATEDLGNGRKNKERSKVNAGVTTSTPMTEETSRQRSTTPRGRKRRNQSEHQGSDGETKKQGTPVNSAKAQKVQKKGRPPKARGVRKKGRSRGRKSAA